MRLGMNDLYPTRVLYSRFRDVEVIESTIQALIRHVDLKTGTNEKAGEDLLDIQDGDLKRFVNAEVVPAFDDYLQQSMGTSIDDYHYELKAWLTGTQGNYNLMLHNHSGATLSAVFYLLAEETTLGGELVFCDPRINANRGYSSDFSREFDYTRIQPRTGEIYVFPSYFYHFVTPYQGSLRLAVPVDLYLQTRDRG